MLILGMIPTKMFILLHYNFFFFLICHVLIKITKHELIINSLNNIWCIIRPVSPKQFLISSFLFIFSLENLSLDDIQSLLLSAWLALNHFPSPTISTVLCALLTLTTGQQDPITTAMLHAQSLCVTSRHRTIRHLASCLK